MFKGVKSTNSFITTSNRPFFSSKGKKSTILLSLATSSPIYKCTFRQGIDSRPFSLKKKKSAWRRYGSYGTYPKGGVEAVQDSLRALHVHGRESLNHPACSISHEPVSQRQSQSTTNVVRTEVSQKTNCNLQPTRFSLSLSLSFSPHALPC